MDGVGWGGDGRGWVGRVGMETSVWEWAGMCVMGEGYGGVVWSGWHVGGMRDDWGLGKPGSVTSHT